METYVRWRNAGPRDQKISDREMARLLFALIISPLLVIAFAVHFWRSHQRRTGVLAGTLDAVWSLALASTIGVALMLKAEWVRITEFPDD